MGETFFFYLFSVLAVLSALRVVTAKNPTYAVLSLVLAMFSLAAVFVLLEAYFIAAIHLLVYAGAILVLFLFVVMLLGLGSETGPERPNLYRVFGGMVGVAFLLEALVIYRAVSTAGKVIGGRATGTIEAVGRLLFTQYLLPFEVTSVLLLVGIVGAVVLAKKESA